MFSLHCADAVWPNSFRPFGTEFASGNRRLAVAMRRSQVWTNRAVHLSDDECKSAIKLVQQCVHFLGEFAMTVCMAE